MTFLDEDDQDRALGIPDEFHQRAMLGEAVIRATKLEQELHGEVSGMLADYLRHAMSEASDAAAELIVTHPQDDRAVYELQKRAAPYGSLMAWIRETLADGRAREMDLNEMDEEASNGEGT